MPLHIMRVLCAVAALSGVLPFKAAGASISLFVDGQIGTSVDVEDTFLSAGLVQTRVEHSFARTVEFPPFSLHNHFFGATVDVDAETGGIRGKSNLLAPTEGSLVWGGRINVPLEFLGPSGTVSVPLELTVRSNFNYDGPLPVGATTSGLFDASLEMSNAVFSDKSAFVYSYSESAGMNPILKTTPTGDVVIIESGIPYIEVILRTTLDVLVTNGRGGFEVDARAGGRLVARGGSGGAINAFDSAFLTLRLPPGYTLDPSSPYLSKPFQQPQAIPEPWMTPLLGLVLTSLAIWKRQHT